MNAEHIYRIRRKAPAFRRGYIRRAARSAARLLQSPLTNPTYARGSALHARLAAIAPHIAAASRSHALQPRLCNSPAARSQPVDFSVGREYNVATSAQ